jgi:hypothetical protein
LKNEEFEHIAMKTALFTSEHIYQVYFNTMDLNKVGGISLFEVFVNRIIPDAVTSFITFNIYKDDNYHGTAKTFDIDQNHILFCGNEGPIDISADLTITAIQLCDCKETYSQDTQTCEAINDLNKFTVDPQDTNIYDCDDIDADDDDQKLRKTAQVLCQKDCPEGHYGNKCLPCSEYARQADLLPDVYYTYMEEGGVCKQVGDEDYCTKHTNCLDCQNSRGCIFENNECRNGTIAEQVPILKNLVDRCKDFVKPHDTNKCGDSTVDVDTTNPSTYVPTGDMPKYGSCLYQITSTTSLINDILHITYSDSDEVYVTAVLPDGTTQDVIPMWRRNLNNDSDSNSDDYEIVGAKTVNIAYRSTAYQPQTMFSYSLKSSETKNNNQLGGSIWEILGFVGFAVFIILLLTIIVGFIIYYKCKKSSKNQNNRINQVRNTPTEASKSSFLYLNLIKL